MALRASPRALADCTGRGGTQRRQRVVVAVLGSASSNQ